MRRLALAAALLCIAGTVLGADAEVLKLTGASAPAPLEKSLTLAAGDKGLLPLKDILLTDLQAEPKEDVRVEWVKDVPGRKVTIRFFDIMKPGQYKASFKVQAELMDGKRTGVIPGTVEVAVGLPPKLEVSAKALNFAVARCEDKCLASEWLAPEIGKRSAIVQIKNLSPHEIVVAPAFHSSSQGPLKWSEAMEIQPNSEITVEPLATTSFKVNLPASEAALSAGTYTGKVVFSARQAEAPRFYGSQDGKLALLNEAVQAVDVEIRVRDSAGWGLLVAFCGVALGRLLQSMNSDSYRQSMAMMVRLNALVRDIEATPGSQLLTGLRAMVEQQRVRVDSAAPDQLAVEVTTLERLFDAARSLAIAVQQIEEIRPVPSDAAAQITQIKGVIVEITVQRDTSRFQVTLDAANAYLAQQTPAAAALRASPAQQQGTTAVPESNFGAKVGAGIARGLAFIAGTEAPPVGIAVGIIQPIMTLLLVFLLTIYGVWLVYSGETESAQTFGAQGVAAYVSLFLWGLTAQVVAKTLQTLSFSRS
ncbi:MAG: hypothetical protein IPJ50_06840 [Betaproteobacteria bacterium]|nr:hypothetical protein [Betaproteobacteria bacterium]